MVSTSSGGKGLLSIPARCIKCCHATPFRSSCSWTSAECCTVRFDFSSSAIDRATSPASTGSGEEPMQRCKQENITRCRILFRLRSWNGGQHRPHHGPQSIKQQHAGALLQHWLTGRVLQPLPQPRRSKAMGCRPSQFFFSPHRSWIGLFLIPFSLRKG